MSAESESSLGTRPSLLARLKDWSQQTAWREFDQDYAPMLRNVARKAGLADVEADEVVQETLIAVAKKIGRFEHAGHRGSFRAWLYQQARWRIADQFRARGRANTQIGIELVGNEVESAKATRTDSPLREINSSEVLEADPAFQRLWDAEWQENIRQSALARVKRQAGARQFQLFDLHVIQGLTVQDAARAAGATSAAVFMAKSRVGRLVRKEIERLQAQEP